MDVKFITTTAAKLATLAVVNGQIIALSDEDRYFYDMGGVRRPVSGVHEVAGLPSTGTSNIIYVDSTDSYTASVWNGSTFVAISGSGVEIDDTTASTATVYSSSKVSQLIQGITSFDVIIVSTLPDHDIDTHAIYFLLKTGTTGDTYDEYMYVNNAWELIGTTAVTVSIATTATAGIVKPDGTSISVAADGTIAAIGGGHTIQNKAGTDLTQRTTLQFAGTLQTTDDSTNSKTVVDDSAEAIEWSVWNAMSESEKATYSANRKLDILHVPGVDGSLSADYLTKLWENPNPSQTFAGQNITLSSSDYDLLLFVTRFDTGGDTAVTTTVIQKGQNALISYGFNTVIYNRTIVYNSATLYVAADGYAGGAVSNTSCIPVAIYGIKKSFTFKISAIASDVSTSADKCMLNSGASVETGLNTPTAQSVTVTGNALLESLRIRRLGKVRHLTFTLRNGLVEGNNNSGVIIPAGDRPFESCNYDVCSVDGWVYRVTVASGGDITVYRTAQAGANPNMYVNVTYFTS